MSDEMPYMGSFSIAAAWRAGAVEPAVRITKDEMRAAVLEQAKSALAPEPHHGEDFVEMNANGGLKVEHQGHSEAISRPPSPPESISTTPRVSIGPCPSRLHSLIPPPNYGTVDFHHVYRSSYPQDRNMEFVKSLKIRTVLNLVDTEPSFGYAQWVQEYDIKQIRVNIATNKDEKVNTTLDSLCKALLALLDASNHPVYVHCNQGKHRTGCVVACLRKIQRMPMKDILDEYNTYAGSKARPGDIELIESFDPACVFDYAKTHGYLDGAQPRLNRTDSWITDVDQLAEALSSFAVGRVGTTPPSEDAWEDEIQVAE